MFVPGVRQGEAVRALNRRAHGAWRAPGDGIADNRLADRAQEVLIHRVHEQVNVVSVRRGLVARRWRLGGLALDVFGDWRQCGGWWPFDHPTRARAARAATLVRMWPDCGCTGAGLAGSERPSKRGRTALERPK